MTRLIQVYDEHHSCFLWCLFLIVNFVTVKFNKLKHSNYGRKN